MQHPSLNRASKRLRREARLASGRAWLAPCVGVLLALSACKPKIGDECVLSTDCSTRGDRLCDNSQPFGYCTQFNCKGNGCPEEAACVLFTAAVPGCGFDDRSGPGGGRNARSWCVFTCQSNSDCRDGYVCADPREPPWNGLILDNLQSQRTCLVEPVATVADTGGNASVPEICKPVADAGGPIDASPPRLYDGSTPPSDGGLAAAADGG